MTIGFKEWALVGRALENGTTSLIVRKGGIAEGRDGFRFKHDDFFIFPTLFHEQLEKTRLPTGTDLPVMEEGVVTITARARVEWTRLVTDRAVLKKLEPYHILQPSVVEDRFLYEPKPGEDKTPGVQVAFLRIWKANEPWKFLDAPKYGGCRSWVELPDCPAEIVWTPAVSDTEHAERGKILRELLG